MEITQLSEDAEKISQRYAERHGFDRNSAWFLLKLQEEVGELTQAYLMKTGQGRAKGRTPEELEAGFRAEFADVLCQLLLLARHHGVDVPGEVARKWLVRL